MPAERLELRPLRIEDEASFQDAVSEFATLDSDIPFAFEFESAVCFKTYVEMVNSWSDGKNRPDTFVANSYYVGVVAGRIIGRLSLRHRLNDFLE